MKKMEVKPVIDGTLYELVFDGDPGLEDYLVPAFERLESSNPERDAELFRHVADGVFKWMPFITFGNVQKYYAAVEKLLFAMVSESEDESILKACSSLNGLLLFYIVSEMWWTVHDEEGIDQEGMPMYKKYWVLNNLLEGLYEMNPDAKVGNTLLVTIMEALSIADELDAPEYVQDEWITEYTFYCDELYDRNWIDEGNMLDVAMFFGAVPTMFILSEKEEREYCRKAYELLDRTGNLTADDADISEVVARCRKVLGI